MATVAPTKPFHAEATDMMKKLSFENQPKAPEIPDPIKKTSVDSGNGTNGQVQSYERSMTPLLQDFIDPTVGYIPSYPGYYYGSYDGAANEWDDYSRYANPEGVDLSQGVYGDNGALMYQQYYGYAPYSPYSPAGSPVPTMGHEGNLYGAQQYQYPSPLYQPLNATSPPYNPSPAATVKGDNSAPAATTTEKKTPSLTVETANGNTNATAKGLNNTSSLKKTLKQNSTFSSGASYGRGGLYPSSGFGFDGMRSPIPWFDTTLFPDGQPRPLTSGLMGSNISNGSNATLKNQSFRPLSPYLGLQPRPLSGLNSNAYMNRMYPNKFNNYGNAFRSTFPFGSNCYDQRNGRGWFAVDNKYNKPRGRNSGLFSGYGNENMDGLNELNKGPRARNTKNNPSKGFTPVALAVKGQNIPLNASADDEKDNKTGDEPDREQYNKPDFAETHANAKFYIIKSYSEDDIHKSIKYSVWASTPNGNKKLDAAYQEAQQKSDGCPIFLFFSVNSSGQFVGIAEMVGPVDFQKNFEYWQQDKWDGFFPVKWHIVKDVSNSQLKHITLENNENKPCTNSRDTQEVKLEQGLQMLKIFKEHSSKTCILDDFPFYEGRQKTIQEKKAKQKLFQKPVPERKAATDEKNKEGVVNGELKPHNPSEPNVVEETTAIPANIGDASSKISDNVSVTKVDDAPKAASETKDVVNGIASGTV